VTDRLDRGWLARRSDVVSWAVVTAHLALVFAAVLAAAAVGPSPWVVVAWLWFGLTFTGPLNLMHECAHRLAFRRRRSSDLLGRRVLGPLALADFDAYRERHWAHHRNLGLDTDTKDAYLADIRGPGILHLLVRCLSLREAVRKFTRQSPPAGEPADADAGTGEMADDELALGIGFGFGPTLVRTAVVQAILAGAVLAVAWVAHDGTGRILVSAALAYGFVYLYGLGALTVFMATLRAVAEHQVGADGALSEGRAALRNFSTGPLTRLVFGSYGFSNHATHHREPGVAHYRLPKLTAGLAASEPRLAPTGGYVSMLWRLRRGRRVPRLESVRETERSLPRAPAR
jgi:fatty acid desaturase